jgi:cystathionine beta-lyase
MTVDWLDEARARAAGSLKWSRVGPDTLAAWVAEMDVALAPPVAEALHRAVDSAVVGYPPLERPGDLPDVIADWHARRLDHPIDPDHVLFSAEVISGLAFALSTVLDPGAGVVVPSPAYPPFSEAIAWAGMREIRVPLDGDRLDLAAIDRALAKGATGVVVCNPHNPTGSIPSPTTLAELAAVVRSHDGWVFADEVHAALTHPGHRTTPFSVAAPALADRTITLTSASKAFNLPGLRFAWLVSHDDAVHERLAARPRHDRGPGGVLGQVAARAALTEGDDWLDALRSDLVDRHTTVRSALEPALGPEAIARPAASYLAWIDLTASRIGDDPARRARGAGVRVSPGTDYGREGVGHIRLNVAAHPDTLDRVLERLLDMV